MDSVDRKKKIAGGGGGVRCTLIVSITKYMKLFVVSVKAGHSLAVLVVLLVLLISVSVKFSLLSKLSKSIVLNRLSNSNSYLNK